jgi:hypothetical protein
MVGGKEVGSQSGFLQRLGDLTEDAVTSRASNLDVSSLRALKDKFPEIFEKAKQAKINDMITRSTNAVSGFNQAAFSKQFNKLGPELQEMLFDPEMISHIKNLSMLQSEIPAKLGPSGTPEAMFTMDMFNVKRNVGDFGIKKVLDFTSKGMPRPEPIAEPVAKGITNIFEGATKSSLPPAITRPHLQIVPRAAEKQDAAQVDKDLIMQKVAGSKYQQVLENAAQKGGQSFAAAHYVLSERDQDFQKLMRGGGQ